MEIRVTLFFIGAIFDILYSIGPIKVCTDFEINRYKIDEYAKIVFYLIYLTSRDAKKSYIMRHGDSNTSDRYFDKEHFEINQKSLRLPGQKLWLK